MDKKSILESIMAEINQSKIIKEVKLPYVDENLRMGDKIERSLLQHKHSLGLHPAFPEDDEHSFDHKVVTDRFNNVVNNVKKHFDVEDISTINQMTTINQLLTEIIKIETPKRDELEELAVTLVNEVFDLPEDALNITTELTNQLTLKPTEVTYEPDEDGFESHSEISQLNKHVYKRRLLNALIQGAANKVNHMYFLIEKELDNISPLLVSKYKKLMSLTEYSYFFNDKNDSNYVGGVVKVDLPKNETAMPAINAQAIIFPLLIHELVKGVMEVLAAHGLPDNTKHRDYVLSKADLTGAEFWDMRIGVPLWEKFNDLFDTDDNSYKHHVFAEIVQLPPDEFHDIFKEIFSGTKLAKKYIKDSIKHHKRSISEYDFDQRLKEKRGI
jgi:hypothetical protein